MNARGLTLLEMLLALALLGGLSSLLTAWVVTVPRVSAEQSPELQWRRAAERVLESIADDLACGDFEPAARTREAASKFEISGDGRLRISTRSVQAIEGKPLGPVVHQYEFNARSQELCLAAALPDQPAPESRRVLLSRVDAWRVASDERDQSITVSVRSVDGDEITRTFAWP